MTTFMQFVTTTLATCKMPAWGLTKAATRVNFGNQVSHELKTPLTNIRMYADLLDEDLHVLDEDDAEMRELAQEEITANSEQIETLEIELQKLLSRTSARVGLVMAIAVALIRPRHMLTLAIRHCLAHMRVARVRAVVAL